MSSAMLREEWDRWIPFLASFGFLLLLAEICTAATLDAVSREVVLRRGTTEISIASREVVFVVIPRENDVVSREVVLFRGQQTRDVVTREYSVNLLGDVTVLEGYLSREYAKIPEQRADWMSLAIQTSPHVPGYLDLFVAATTDQFGSPTDEPDDHIYRVRRLDLKVEPYLSFASSETDPIDIAFGPEGEWGSSLFVAARHLDGYAGGDTGGALLEIDRRGDLLTFYDDTGVGTAPTAIAFAPASSVAFGDDLLCANANPSPSSVFAVGPEGSLGTFQAVHAQGFESAAFAPGNAFGSDLFVGSVDGFIRRVDAAGNVTSFGTNLGAPVQSLAFATGYDFGERLYALLGNGQVLRIDPGGQSEVFLEGLLIQPIANGVVRNDLTFTPAGDLLHVTDALRGAVYGIQSILPTGVEDDTPPPSVATALLANHPNPFNPRTTLRFHLESAVAVDLLIYDAAGRRVRSLSAGEEFSAGTHEIVWNGEDDRGRRAASGVYHVRLRAGEFEATGKMTLLK